MSKSILTLLRSAHFSCCVIDDERDVRTLPAWAYSPVPAKYTDGRQTKNASPFDVHHASFEWACVALLK